jgi:hypothetical protein
LARLLDEVQAGVAARYDEDDCRMRELAVLQGQRLDVAGQVMHGNQRQPGGRGRRLGERHADEERSHEAGALSDGNGAQTAPCRLCLG